MSTTETYSKKRGGEHSEEREPIKIFRELPDNTVGRNSYPA